MAGSYKIFLRDDAPRYRLSHLKLRRLAGNMLRSLGWKRAEFSLWLVYDRRMASINKRFLNHEGPTDVISFSQIEGKLLAYAGKTPFLGDIVISLDTAKRQAQDYGNDFFYEVCFYLCHGILHLMGHDDQTPKEASWMERKQKQVLEKMGISRRPASLRPLFEERE